MLKIDLIKFWTLSNFATVQREGGKLKKYIKLNLIKILIFKNILNIQKKVNKKFLWDYSNREEKEKYIICLKSTL